MKKLVLALAASVAFAGCMPGSTVGSGTGGKQGGSGGTPGSGGSSGTGNSGTGGTISPGTGGSVVTGTGGTPPTTGGSTGSGGSGPGGTGGSVSGGTGGTMTGSGGAATGGSMGGAGARGGGGATGGQIGTGTGGSSTGNGGQGAFPRAAGKVWNTALPASMTNVAKADWKNGLISTTQVDKHHINQAMIVNGYLVVGGNEEFWIVDVSDAKAPKQLSAFKAPTAIAGKEAESHTLSAARYGDKFYLATIGGTGVDTWDITNPMSVKHLGLAVISGVNYGDYTEAIWGVAWQGQYIYVGATNNGIHVIDAADPAALKVVGQIPTSQYGGVSAGPVDPVGNVLVTMTPKESAGIATLDISDPTKLVKLASLTATTKSYIGQMHRHYAFLVQPVRAWDVLTNPKNIGTGSAPLVTLNTDYAEYMNFSDDYLFLGHARTSVSSGPGASKINVSDIHNMKITERIWGRLDDGEINDDQFTLPFGNVLFLGDDESPYYGWVLAVHQAEPDTKPPVVDTVIPKSASTDVSTKSRIGITFSDNIELATVSTATFIVRPVGGQALPGKFGVRMSILNFDPDGDLQPGTTYEVVLPKGGIADYVGNTLAAEWKSTFTTAN